MAKNRIFLIFKKGFTLVELIVVISMMALTATLIAPNIKDAISSTKYRKDISYCISASTYVRNYVNLLNLGETKIPYEDNGKYKYYTMTEAGGLQDALNHYNLESGFQYYVLAFNTATNVDPTTTVTNAISDGMEQMDTMVVCIWLTEGVYTLYGFWYYEYDSESIFCTYRCTGKSKEKQNRGLVALT